MPYVIHISGFQFSGDESNRHQVGNNKNTRTAYVILVFGETEYHKPIRGGVFTAWKSYKELIVWQKSMVLTSSIYCLTNKLPKAELYGLSDQLRRAAVSIPSNIAEGHGRQSCKDFCHFLSIANGSCMEIETQLLICTNLKMLTDEDIQDALSMVNEISRMLIAMMLKIKNSNTPEN